MKEWHCTPAQRKALETELAQTQDVGVFRRTLALLEASQGRPIVEVARMLRVDRRSVLPVQCAQIIAAGDGKMPRALCS
jgi:hypothetical protein